LESNEQIPNFVGVRIWSNLENRNFDPFKLLLQIRRRVGKEFASPRCAFSSNAFGNTKLGLVANIQKPELAIPEIAQRSQALLPVYNLMLLSRRFVQTGALYDM